MTNRLGLIRACVARACATVAAAAATFFTLNVDAQTVTGMQGLGYQAPVIENSAPDGQGFHAGGVAACDGCHLMHNAGGGVAKSTTEGSGVAPWTNVTNPYLLQAADQSSTCLICHSGTLAAGNQYTVADFSDGNTPGNRTPGGDFGWVRIAFGPTSPSQRHGHNISALDFAIDEDADLPVAPGGTYRSGTTPLSKFGCSSCHDPHGRYRLQPGTDRAGVVVAGPFPGSPETLPIAASGSYGAEPTTEYAVGVYRLLAGRSYAPASNSSYPFEFDPPVAVAPMTYNASEAISEVRVAYGTGMSEWCQNCHTHIHLNVYTSGGANLRHPAGSDAVLKPFQYEVYNKYVASGVVDQGATARYTSLVPFEQGKETAIATLRANATADSIIEAGASSNVMCLSCHRAHASAFDSMVRWDQNATFLTDASNYTPGVSSRTLAQTLAGYYDRPVGTDSSTAIGKYQRSLCNKCHGKD